MSEYKILRAESGGRRLFSLVEHSSDMRGTPVHLGHINIEKEVYKSEGTHFDCYLVEYPNHSHSILLVYGNNRGDTWNFFLVDIPEHDDGNYARWPLYDQARRWARERGLIPAPPAPSAAHKHAALMAQYAEDAAKTNEPWWRWELKAPSAPESYWKPLSTHPTWREDCAYRRKPAVQTFRVSCTVDVDAPTCEEARAMFDALVRKGTGGIEVVVLPVGDKQ